MKPHSLYVIEECERPLNERRHQIVVAPERRQSRHRDPIVSENGQLEIALSRSLVQVVDPNRERCKQRRIREGWKPRFELFELRFTEYAQSVAPGPVRAPRKRPRHRQRKGKVPTLGRYHCRHFGSRLVFTSPLLEELDSLRGYQYFDIDR